MRERKNNSREFVFNTMAGIVAILGMTLTSIVVPKLILDVYGKEITGLVASITQFMSFFLLIDAGLTNSVIVNLYRPLTISDFHSVSRILAAARILYLRISLLFGCIVLITAILYPFVVKDKTVSYPVITLLTIILGLNGILEFFSIRKYSNILNADNMVGIVRLTFFIRSILQCIIVAILVKFKLHIIWVELGYVSAIIICPVLLHLACYKRYSKIDYTAEPDMYALSNRHDAMIAPLTLAAQTTAPIMIATILLPVQEVGILAMYLIVVRGIDNIMNVFNSSAAVFGQIYASGDSKRLERAYGQFELICCIVTTSVFAVMTINYEPFMEIYSGNVVHGLALLCCIRGFLLNLRLPQNNMLNGIGWFHGTRRYMIAQTAILLVAGTLLGLKFGVIGIFVGDILSNIYRDAEILIHIPRKVGFHILPSVKRWLISVCCFAVLWAVLPFVKTWFYTTKGYVAWLGFSAIAVILALVITVSAFSIFDGKTLLLVYRTKIEPVASKVKRKMVS